MVGFLLTLAVAQPDPEQSFNCTDTAHHDVLCSPESGLNSCVDVVAYWSLAKHVRPVMVPNRTYTSELSGGTFRFASAANKALFDADPWKYAPAYGGF